jgi:AcrR family transcriptional regulator
LRVYSIALQEPQLPKLIDLNRIHKSTLQVFVERGYEAATTREIAERAGVNEATLYRRFNTKAELIRTALEHELVDSPFGSLKGSDDVHADIAMIARSYIETFEVFGAIVMALIGNAAKHPEIQSATSALLPNLQNAAQIIAKHQAAGRVTPGKPLAKLLQLIAPLAMMGFLSRSGMGIAGDMSQLDPERIATDFLNGHSV